MEKEEVMVRERVGREDWAIPSKLDRLEAKVLGVKIVRWKKTQHTVRAAANLPKGRVIDKYGTTQWQPGDDLRYAVDINNEVRDGKRPVGFAKFANHSCCPGTKT